MKLALTQGSTSVIAHLFMKDSSVTDGSGKTGLVFGDFTVCYVRAGGVLTALTTQTITTLGTYQAPTGAAYIRIKAVSDVSAPGLYEVQFHNSQLAAGANQATFLFRAAGAMPEVVEIQLAPVPANMTQINGAATDGYNATLSLKQLDIENPDGIAMRLVSNKSDSSALMLQTSADGAWPLMISGSSHGQHGIYIVGVDTGIRIEAGAGQSGQGRVLYGTTTHGDGVRIDSAGDGHVDLVLDLSTSQHDAIADAVLDEVVETVGVTSWTPRKLFRLLSSVLFGKASGGGTTTVKFRDLGDTKDRVSATVNNKGDRTAVTLDGS